MNDIIDLHRIELIVCLNYVRKKTYHQRSRRQVRLHNVTINNKTQANEIIGILTRNKFQNYHVGSPVVL